jgi:GNAT superfamily N-acetyltransferase
VGKGDSVAIDVRDAGPADAASLAALFLRARAAAMPGLHEPHAEGAVAGWLADVLMRDHHVRVATMGDKTAGYIGHGQDADHGAMVFHLYLDPAWQRRGIGSRLLGEAIAAHAAPLSLICFARNAGGRAFYQAHGFRPAAFRCGAANEEGEPDIVYTRDAGPVLPLPREDQP